MRVPNKNLNVSVGFESAIGKSHHGKHHPKAGNRATATIATVNDDFTDHKSNLRKVNADVVMLQETKNSKLRTLRPDTSAYGVHQNSSRDDLAGSSIVWKKNQAHVTQKGFALGVKPHGRAMLTRYLNFTDMKIDGVKVRMVSAHRPPKRFAALWPAFDRNLARFVKSHQGPIVIGMDANQQNPQQMAKLTGLKWHAPPKKPGEGNIDGFLASPGIRFENIHRLPKGTSDHHPVVAKISIPKTSRGSLTS